MGFPVPGVRQCTRPRRSADGAEAGFDASASFDPDGTLVSYRFTWGDGTPDGFTGGPTATHVFHGPGDYPVHLTVTDDGFSITLNFGNQPEPMVIPFDAIRTFVDPSVEFGLRFETHDDDEDEEEAGMIEAEEEEPPAKDADVVSLDSFRK